MALLLNTRDTQAKQKALMMLKILNILFMFFGGFHRIECAKIFTFFCFRVYFPGVDAIFA